MNMVVFSARLAACAITALSLSQCVVTEDSGSHSGSTPDPTSGTISVYSSIEGSTQASACDAARATELELVIYAGSSHYTTVASSCYKFALTVSLPDGNYNADATLLDGDQAASTTLSLRDLRVVHGTDLQVDIDFPASSILP